MEKKIALIGQMRSGKNYVARHFGYQEMGFADPIYALVDYFFDTTDKAQTRRFMQQIGQWGRGEVSEKYPLTWDRALTTQQIRSLPDDFLLTFDNGHAAIDVSWWAFGTHQDFWVDIAMDRVSGYSGKLAICNVRYLNEIEACYEAGIPIYLVVTDWLTRIRRLAELGEEDSHDVSEDLAGFLTQIAEGKPLHKAHHSKLPREEILQSIRVIRNDDVPFVDESIVLSRDTIAQEEDRHKPEDLFY